jgi:hypothetical protein
MCCFAGKEVSFISGISGTAYFLSSINRLRAGDA